MVTYEQIEQVNKEIKPTEIKGKQYAEVNQRIKAFRKLYPNGKISTEIVKHENGVVIMKSTIFDDERIVIATGFASEKENSNNINKTSYIENCETSAVGRALGMCGLGIDCQVASKEEMEGKVVSAEVLEKELEKLSIEYSKLRTTLTELEYDFRREDINAWILNDAKVETQDLEELNNEDLKKLNKCYRRIIAKIKDRLMQEKSQKVIDEAGGF